LQGPFQSWCALQGPFQWWCALQGSFLHMVFTNSAFSFNTLYTA
jgi:hypothetical protein